MASTTRWLSMGNKLPKTMGSWHGVWWVAPKFSFLRKVVQNEGSTNRDRCTQMKVWGDSTSFSKGFWVFSSHSLSLVSTFHRILNVILLIYMNDVF